MTTPLPSNISYGTVKGRFATATLTSGDADGFPNLTPATGLTITFTAATASVLDKTASPAPVTIEMVPIVCQVDSSGYLLGGDGQRGVQLIATSDIDLDPHDWTYRVSFLRAGAKPAAFRDFDMTITAGTEYDITLVSPVPSATGVSLSQAQSAELAAVAAASAAAASATAAAASTALFSVDNLPQAGTTGKAIMKTATATAARTAIGATTAGATLLTAADAAAQRVAIAPADGIDIQGLGHSGTEGNADAYFLTAQQNARTRRRTNSLSGTNWGTTTIEIPAGDYTVTAINALLGRETQSGNTNGVRFKGAGPGMTNIIFTPAAAGAMVFNNWWQNIGFDGISFITTVDGSTFLQSYTTQAAQAYIFRNCSWTGPWMYIFDLQGSNNNSEWTFDRCSTSGMNDAGAFLNIDATLGSDQFLNYWFYSFKHWSTGASVIRAGKGGHFHFYGLDCSAFGTSLTAASYLFDLRGSSHSAGVQSLTVEGMRVEAKNALCGLLHSEWGTGNVAIECDWSSQIGGYTYGDIIDLSIINVGGPVYNFHDSNLAGGIKVTYGSSTYQHAPRIIVQNSIWHQKLTPSEVVTFVETGAAANLTRPGVEFTNCRSDYNDYTHANGMSVWDALVSHRTPVRPIRKRSLKVSSFVGSLKAASTQPTINLPIGAIITGIRAFAPAGAHTGASGGTWTLNTTDASPVAIAAVTVATSLTLGYSQVTELAVPFLCSTRAQATVKVVTTTVTTSSFDAYLVIEGYW